MPSGLPDASGSSRRPPPELRRIARTWAQHSTTCARATRSWSALGRSLKHLIDTVTGLNERGVGFRSIHENIDTTTSAGKLVFHIFAALAEFERDLIVDRTRAGLAAARERGSKPGRKPSLSADQVAVARKMHDAGQHTVQQIADVVGVSRATIYRAIAASGIGA